MNSKLFDIFIPLRDKFHFSKQELLSLVIYDTFIKQIAKQLDLTYMENDSEGNNLCFADSEQLRPAYRMFFSKSDLIDYLSFALKADEFDIRTDEVLFPKREVFFIN